MTEDKSGYGKFAWILAEAQAEFAKNPNWMDFSNKFFGNGNKYVPKDRTERQEFLESEEYKAIREMRDQLEALQADVTEPEETAEYNGRISLRVPKSLHKSLVEEADREGISLNQLLLAKISARLYDQLRDRK